VTVAARLSGAAQRQRLESLGSLPDDMEVHDVEGHPGEPLDLLVGALGEESRRDIAVVR
jgi:hypothetical protein